MADALIGPIPSEGEDGARIMRIQGQLEQTRMHYEQTWRELARFVLPRAGLFTAGGDRQTYGSLETDLFDSTAPMALERFGAAMEQMLTPRSTVWHGIKAPRSAGPLGRSYLATRFYEGVRDSLFDHRYSSSSMFASVMAEGYQGIGAFGTGALYCEGNTTDVIRYKSVPLAELWTARDAWGNLARAHWKCKYQAHALLEEYGEVPEKVRTANAQNPFKELEVLHAVELNTARDTSRADRRGMRFASFHVLCDGKHVLRRGGYRVMPYIVGRYALSAGEEYGRSPGLTALADIRMLNQMSRTLIRRANWESEPPWASSDDDFGQPPLLEPNAINPGFLTADGKPKLVPLQPGGSYSVGLDMQEQRRKAINDVFLVTLFQVLIEAPQMTATEVLQRAQEKGALMAPLMGRQQGEMLGPLIEREIDILADAGQLPEPPEEIVEMGGVYEVEYQSPLAKLQKAEEGVAIMRTLEGILPVAANDPSVLDNYDMDELARGLGEANGMAARFLRDPRARDQMRAERAQANQQRELAAAAPGLGSALKDAAQAGAMARPA